MSERPEGRWQVRISAPADAMIGAIRDKRVRAKIVEAIASLAEAPDLRGKPLVGELAGYRSLRAVGQRYRIIYRIEAEQVVVYVVAVGLRKEGDKADIYRLAQRLVRLGLMEPDADSPDRP